MSAGAVVLSSGATAALTPEAPGDGGGVPMSIKPTCINLEERFGRRYRVSWEADGATRYQWPEAERPWLMKIRGRRGVVYPFGGEILAAVGTGARIGAKLRALPCIRSARGDIETVVTFHIDDAPAVFALLRPYRRRQVSTAERERLRALGFQRRAHSQSDFPALESTHATPNDSEAVPATEGGANAV